MLRGAERMGHGIEGGKLLGVSDGGPQASLRLLKLEPKERTARTLDGKGLVERVSIEALVELQYQRFEFPLQALDARGETGVAGALLANAGFIQPAAQYPGNGLVKGTGGRRVG